MNISKILSNQIIAKAMLAMFKKMLSGTTKAVLFRLDSEGNLLIQTFDENNKLIENGKV